MCVWQHREVPRFSVAEKKAPCRPHEMNGAIFMTAVVENVSAAILRYCNSQTLNHNGKFTQLLTDASRKRKIASEGKSNDVKEREVGCGMSSLLISQTTEKNEEIYAGFERDLSMAKAFSMDLAKIQKNKQLSRLQRYTLGFNETYLWRKPSRKI